METTRNWRAGVLAIVLYASGCAASGQGLALLHRATETDTVRVLVENLSAEDAAAVDPQKVCVESPAVQDMWFDVLRLLGMGEALRSYARCGIGVNPDLIEAMSLPLTPERLARIERYIGTLKEGLVPPDTIVETTSREPITQSDWYTLQVLVTLEADGTSAALEVCDRLGVKVGHQCSAQLLTGNRIFDTAESAVANDPFLARYKARHAATSRDRQRRIYTLEALTPHESECHPIAVLAAQSGRWSLERVECGTGLTWSTIAEENRSVPHESNR